MIVKHTFVILVAVSVMLWPVHGALAQNKDPGFSQLDFDQAAKAKPQAGIVDPEDLLKEGAVKVPGAVEIDQSSIDAILRGRPREEHNAQTKPLLNPAIEVEENVSEAAVVDTHVVEVEIDRPDDPRRLLVPNLKGPAHDRGNSSRITSTTTWRHVFKKSCQEPLSAQHSENKGKALREVITRFSGDKQLVADLCWNVCVGDEQAGELTGLTIIDTQGGEFKFLASGNECFYRLSKPTDSTWKALAVGRIACKCP